MMNCKKLCSNLLLSISTILLLALSAQADTWATAPSGLARGQTATISGGNLEANETILLEITYPDETVATFALLADAAGEITFDLNLTQAGNYTGKILDASGASDDPLTTFIISAAE
ncbi:MAG: hypothetical protein V1706_08045 [Pseudomonadota bacterium]